MKIGDTVWEFDINRRVYDGSGMSAKVIYREHWHPVTITGETSRSWIAGVYGKIPKRGDHRGWAFSLQEVDDDVWSHDTRHKVVRMVECCDVTTLRKVAELVGYSEASA